jgi:hypothetical protein
MEELINKLERNYRLELNCDDESHIIKYIKIAIKASLYNMKYDVINILNLKLLLQINLKQKLLLII